MAYTFSQLEGIWIQAGGSAATAAVAAAVALAESSGNKDVTSHNPDGGTNVGLWQLDTPGGKGAGYSVAQLQDPIINAKAAIAGSNNGQNWSAWETYVTGAYRRFLSNAAPSNVPELGSAASSTPTTSSGSSGGIGDIFSWLTSIPNTFKDVFTLFHNLISPSFWLRVGAFFTGAALLVVGIYVMMKANSDSSIMPKVVPIPV
jgi:lysozyme-like protein